MHRDSDALGEQRVLDFLGEKPLALHLLKRPVDFRVAARLDHHDLGGGTVARQLGLDPLRLPQRQLAAARADAQRGHRGAPAKCCTIAWTRPCAVYSAASMATGRPSSRAVAAVTGPITAAAY